MKILIASLIVIILNSCATSTDDKGKKARFGMQIMELNGCQYAVYVDDSHGGTAMVHAANCRNSEHIKIIRDSNGDYTPTLTR